MNSENSTIKNELEEFDVLQRVIGALQSLNSEARQRILGSAATFLSIDSYSNATSSTQAAARVLSNSSQTAPAYSIDTAMSPKEFILEKQPRTDVERVACLAFYLTHYEDTPHFKTLELSKLNMTAAQPKFTNTSQSTNNALKMGYLVPALKGQRQLSAAGEQFVRALPDRDAARQAMSTARPRRKTKKNKTSVDGAAG